MVGSSKILTVSYGTFSCTLEGFDDPFSAMKSIAEYFRDLAADDRYFGAEPPTPDAEMLHRIAEREVQRRVESRVHKDGVTLRQLATDEDDDDTPETGYAEAAPSAPLAYSGDGDSEPERKKKKKKKKKDREDSVADKLSRIRAVVERARDAAQMADDGDEDEDDDGAEGFEDLIEEETRLESAIAGLMAVDSAYEDEEPAGDSKEAAPAATGWDVAEEETEAEDFAVADTHPADEDDVGAEAAEAPEEYEVAAAAGYDYEPEAPAAAVEAHYAYAERAEVAVAGDEAFGADDDATAVSGEETEAHEVSAEEAASADDAAADQEMAEEDETFAHPGMAGADDLAAAAAYEEAAGDSGISEPVAEEDEENAAAWHGAPDGEPAEAEAVAEEAEEEFAEAQEPAWAVAETEEPEATASEAEEADEVVAAAEDSGEVEAEAEERDEDFAAAAEVEPEDIPEPQTGDEALRPAAYDSAEPVIARNVSEPSISDRIAALRSAELSHGHLIDEDDDNFATDPAAASSAEEPSRETRRSALIATDLDNEPGFNRILAETNTKMAESEGTRRRSAIAHLKAAVAATKADRLLKRDRSGEEDAEEQSRYREDLAKVVRPRKSEPRENAADKRPKPLEAVTAPLMLVSAQRVDGGKAGPQDEDFAVRPRRIGAGMLALDHEARIVDDEDDDDSDFVDFAQSMGARDLPDLLEAAAAYTAFVENQPHFSRPQIMRRAAAIETDEEFTREAGLRSFGQLLRQGRIRKLQRGQFTIAENTRFRPQARIAGE